MSDELKEKTPGQVASEEGETEKGQQETGVSPADEVEIVELVDEEEPSLAPLPTASSTEELEAEVRRLTAELDEKHDGYLRKLAEFDNFRKRVAREREELERSAAESLVRDLVPVLDNFERGLQHTSAGDTGGFRLGIEMIQRQLWDVLQRRGLSVVDPTGQRFQPELHEAVQRVETSESEPGQIVGVMAKGYLFGGRLLRPALVAVAVEPTAPAGEAAANGTTEPEGEGGA